MKTILILRHAKSSRDDPFLADHDRPLKKRGKRDAPRMGELLQKESLVPDAILSSTARRARDTAVEVAIACHYPGEITFNPEFYIAEQEVFWQALSELDDNVECVMLVGHNPELEEFVHELTGEFVILPTAALAQIELPLDNWIDLHPGQTGNLVGLWKPREIE